MPRRKWGSGAALFLLAVLVIHNFHYTLGSISNVKQDGFKGYNQHPLNSLHSSPSRKWFKNFAEIKERKDISEELIGWVFNDVAQMGPVTYSIHVDKNPNVPVFSVKKTCGFVYVHYPIDREKTPFFSITFDVHNATNNERLAESLNVIIQIQDINDNAPQFSQQEFNVIIKGNYHKGQKFYRMTAFDSDQKGTANSEVVYSLISQTPELKLPLFCIDPSSGFMNITQCLDYEASRNFRVLIMASDLGPSPQSSIAAVNITVEDSNYYLPEFTQKYYHAAVPKGTSESNILRLKVKDKDTPNTPAWRAKYTIKTGNERGNFVVITDSITNEGILRVVKPLVYSSLSVRRLVIVVENELPFFLCEGGLQPPFFEASVSINITDQNYPPRFIPPILHLEYQEGVKAGTILNSYIAHDSDTAQDKIRYKIGSDPSGWLTISENYGTVTIARTLGRESLFMNKTILIHAIDDGIPPLTGTGTIQLYIRPSELIIVPNLRICEGKGLGPFRITREVKDYDLYAGSLTVQLEDAANLWRLEKSSGNLVELFMLKNLSLGDYLVPLHIQDFQGVFRQQTLNVQVCTCTDGINCDFTNRIIGKPLTASMGPGGIIGITVTICLLLISFLGILFRYSFICKPDVRIPFVPYEGGNQSLIHYNEESEQVLNRSVTDMIRPTMDLPGGSPFIRILNPNPVKPWEKVIHRSNYNTKISEFLKTVEVTLKQKCKEINNRVDNMVSYTPHVYAEEGPLETSKSLLSLLGREEKNSLPSNLLNDTGSIFDPLRKIYSK